MASTKKQIVDLLRETARSIFESSEAYLRFLDCAAANYKYCWRDQIAIYAQRPNATACADFKQWNDLGYWIKGGTSGIALIDDSGLGSTGLRYVYDIADTRKLTGPSVLIWEVKDNQKGSVAKEIQKRFALNTASSDFGVLLSAWADRVAEDRQESWLAELRSAMQTNTEDENRAKEFVLESARYMLYRRCNLEPENKAYFDVYFANESRYNQLTEICILGQAASAAAEEALREIEKAVKHVTREERSRQHGTELQENGRVLSSGVGSARGTEDREVRDAETVLSSGTSDGAVYGNDDGRDIERSSRGDRSESQRDDGGDHRENDERVASERRAEGQRSNEMGGADEQHSTHSRGNHFFGADLRLNIESNAGLEQVTLFPSEEEQKEQILKAENVKTSSAFFFSQDDIDHVLRLGGNTYRQRERIVAAFEEQKPTAEIADTLKNLYHGGNGIGSITAWYAEDGIHLSHGKTARYDKSAQVISWESAAERIGQLLQDGQFATNVELAEAEGYERSSLAEKLWHLYHDFSDNAREAGYLKSLAKNPGHGFPEESEWLTAQLRNPEFRRTLAEEYTVFWMAYRQDRKLLRFHYHSLEEMDKTLKGLSLPRITFSSALTEIPAVKQFITEDEINDSLSNGSSVSGGKGRIFSFFQENHTDKEKADFLKHEYGIGGHSHALSRAGNSWEGHDGKGLEYRKDGCQDVRISWEKVSRRITDLINRGRYLTEQEQAEYSRIQEEKALAEEEIVNVSQEKAVSDVEYDLGYGHLGNGITVWNRLEEEFGDYKNVAHISPDRTVTFYDERLPENLRDEIQQVAATSTMTVSATQDIPVFSVPPMEREIQPTRTVRDIFASYLPIICEKLLEDKDYQNACQFSDKENAVSEGKKAIKRIVSTIEDQDFRQIYYGNDRFHIDLNREVLDNTYRELSQNQQLETETRSGSESMEPYQHNYRLLSRLRMDCEYYLGYGNRADKNLWAGNVPDQIAKMRELYQTLPEKPDWISLDDIDRYEREMSRNTEPQYLPDSDPYIVCNWSESSIFEDGKRYSIKEFDTLMKEADEERVAGAKAAMEKYGTWQKWYEADDPEAARFLGYDKTKFTVVMPTGETYTERQDIGDGDGGVIDFLSQYPAYKNIVPILREAAMQPEPKTFSAKENTSEIETQTAQDETLTELQKKALEIADRYKDLPLQAKIDVIAQAFGCKTGKIHTSPCTGKWRGTSDMTIRFDNGASLFIGNCLTPKAKTVKVQTEYVDRAVVQYNAEIVKATKEAALPVLLQREAKDNEIAAEKGLKPYTLLNVEFNEGADEKTGGYIGWYYVTLAVDGKICTHLETGLNLDIASGKVSDTPTRTDYFPAGALKESDVDYVFYNVGFSTTSSLYTVPLRDDVRERAEKTLAERISAVQEEHSEARKLHEESELLSEQKDVSKSYDDLKAEYPDAIVLYQVGDFFEVYGDDAKKAAAELDLNLFTRSVSSGGRVEMCGFPTNRLEQYIEQLRVKHNVAISAIPEGSNQRQFYTVFSGNIEGAQSIEVSKADYSVEGDVSTGWSIPENTTDIPVERCTYHITDDELGVGTPMQRYKNNIAAVQLLKKLESEGRLATPEEQEILARYVGWGGLADCFDQRHSRYAELKALLTEAEYNAARESTLTAFYTPPVVVRAIYQVLSNMGFQTGNVLEPSCGIGNFIGMLPTEMQNSKIYGVELDSISGRIAQQLYQDTKIAVQGFENTDFPDSFFDVAVGNVPFGQFKVSDRRYNKYNFLIHDYFFARTLDKVRPGGVIAFITSKGTLDKENPSVRKYIAQRADLLGAIRLPQDTFKQAAGTEVTSDILFLQKRDRMISTEPDWVHLDRDANGCVMNAYFVEHPQMILGEMKEVSGPYGPETACIAREGEDLEEMLSYAIRSIYGSITETQIGEPEELNADSIPADPTVRNFSFTITDGKVYYRENSLMHPVQVSAAAEKRIKALIALRDCVRTLIEYQTEDYPDADIRAQREQLNDVYDAFAKQFGRINSRENKRVFRDDDAYYLMSSLEVLDEEGNFVRKADMFEKRTIRPAAVVEHVDTASEALTVSLGEKGRVDIAYMAELTGKSEQELEADLRGVIFRDIDCPESAEKISPESVDLSQYPLVAADEYLSGNVRRKLRMARAMYDAAPEPLKDAVEPNVQALEKVQPEDLTADKISVRLGATWLPVSVVEQFMYELFDTPEYAKKEIHVLYSKHTSQWNITRKSLDYTNVLASSTYGTGRANGYRLLEEALNLRNVRVFDYTETSDGKRVAVVNEEETLAAQSKEDQIKAAFADWIWADPERRREICELYNEKFNSTRPREYDGSFLRFAGINPEIKLRPHQVNAIARILLGGNTLLAHVVGAGKTFEMIAAAMESKRLGLCSKSLVAVPNHLTEQWASEWLQLYPSASLLVATEADFTTQKRKRFCARIATGDYDGIIIGHSQLEKIPLSQERLREGLEKQRKEIFDEILEIKRKDGDRFSVKQLEKKMKDVERKLHELNDQSSKDSVVTFEELGVDRLFVDEAHYFKNLAAFTKMHNVSGINQIEAKKSSDLFLKCRYLDELTDGHGVVFATGTPISNTMVELYTMQRYLQYYTLERYGLLHFDAWASAFGETVTAIELAPEGTGYRSKTRFARFYNLPELMTIFREIADIQTADMLQLPVPKANYQTVQLEPSAFQKEMIQEFGQRAERVRSRMVTPGEDNMLKITGDGRKLALDQRLTNPMLPDSETSKTTACAERIYEIWKQGESEKWTQLVFCDFSTPAKKNPIQMEENQDGEIVMAGFQNVYQDLAGKLIAKGIPKNEIAFVHSAKTQADKKKLFAKVRAGQIRVLIGSTDKMGAGTNVQTRLKALHRLTPPWRPSDLEQQDGRIIRQGNENPEVEIYTYVTKGSFDGYMYQTMETKQKFISQIMTSKSAVRTMEDVDASALSYAEIKALCVSDPRIKEKIELDIEVQKLNTLKASYQSQKFALEDRITQYYPREIQSCEARLRNMQKDLAFFNEQPVVDGFSPMTIHGKTYTEKKAAGLALLESVKKMTRPDLVPLGQYRGFAMKLSLNILTGQHVVTLTHMLQYRVELGPDVYGNITRLDNALAGISAEITESEEKLRNLKTQLENAQEEVMKPFAQEDELREKTARVNELNILLNLDASDHQDNKVIDNGGVKGYCQMAVDTQKIKEMEYQSFEITQ